MTNPDTQSTLCIGYRTKTNNAKKKKKKKKNTQKTNECVIAVSF
jgi:hypothetical protein